MFKKILFVTIFAIAGTLFFYGISTAGVCSDLGLPNGCIESTDMGRGLVNSYILKTGSVKSIDIQNGGVTSIDIANSTITDIDISNTTSLTMQDLYLNGDDMYNSFNDNADSFWYNRSTYDYRIIMDRDNDNTNSWFQVAAIISGVTKTHLRLYEGSGNLNILGAYQATFNDLAEMISTVEALEAGDVVVIDPLNDESVVLSSFPYDTAVAGIVSTNPGVLLGAEGFSEENEIALAAIKEADMAGNIAQVQALQAVNINQSFTGSAPLALAGRVPCKVTDENGPISRGDLLTTSSTPGHAMRADLDDISKIGSVIGKAMEPLNSGIGVIIVLVGKN